MSLDEMSLDELCINTIRTLSIDAVFQANSGHPGAPLGCAAIAYTLWTRFLRCNPADPAWPDRDRFVLSAGHASALLYSMLHLTGYDLPMEEIKNFRQFGSMTPGHPEADCAPGVETTTGPLGQGLATAVGMAIAERYLAARFNRPDFPIVDHRTFVLASDGDMMEGISHEAASMAGHLKLGKLIVLYDDNKISLEGPTAEWFTDDTAERFRSYGWRTLHVDNASTDVEAIAEAIQQAVDQPDRPTLIHCRTHIGYASPLQDSHKSHGSPLSAEQMAETKRALGWPEDAMFLVPDRAREGFKVVEEQGAKAQSEWRQMFERYAEQHPDLAREWRVAWAGNLPEGWDAKLPTWTAEDKPHATRSAAGSALNAIRETCWQLIGGDADLGSSTKTLPKRRPQHGHRRVHRAEHPLRRARARHGGRLQRHRAARRPARVRLHVHRLLGLLPPVAAPGRPDGGADHLPVHPRQHRPGRGRPDARARRAPGRAARHTALDRHPPRRRQRGRRGLARRHAQRRRARRP